MYHQNTLADLRVDDTLMAFVGKAFEGMGLGAMATRANPVSTTAGGATQEGAQQPRQTSEAENKFAAYLTDKKMKHFHKLALKSYQARTSRYAYLELYV